jgi:hypothetical protein
MDSAPAAPRQKQQANEAAAKTDENEVISAVPMPPTQMKATNNAAAAEAEQPAGPPELTVATSDEPATASHLIVHETYYARYSKFFTTPFKQPKCCEEVYNCHGESICSFYQDLLSNQSEFELIHHIKTQHPFPERRLFKHWFGTYETFLGDLRIYTRKQ